MSATCIDQILREPAEKVGEQIRAMPKTQWFDRKSVMIKAKDLARHLIAFGNAEGGAIVIGLQGGRGEGISENTAQINSFRQAPFDFTHPPVRAHFAELPCINDKGKADRLLIIYIEPGERVHEAGDGDCYLRVGDESRKLSYVQRQELEFDRGQSQYDGFPVGDIALSRLDSGLIRDYGNLIGLDSQPRRILAARSLLTQDDRITNAAYLLFGKTPQDLFPQAYVRVLRYLDNQRGTGTRFELEEGSDIRLEGPLPKIVDQARKTIERLVPKRRALGPNGRFGPIPIVPKDAWLEGLVNAIIHRSYSLAGDHIRVEIYPNRIEIESPGRFPGLVQPRKTLNISRFARNPRIARVCAELGIGQELGEGVRRIFEEMRRAGLNDPVYRQTAGSVRLLLPGSSRLDPNLLAQLPRGSQEIVDALREADRPIGATDLAELLAISRPTLLRKLRVLEEKELVQRIGSGQRDPRATWTLAE